MYSRLMVMLQTEWDHNHRCGQLPDGEEPGLSQHIAQLPQGAQVQDQADQIEDHRNQLQDQSVQVEDHRNQVQDQAVQIDGHRNQV
jgi:hypothetical protein